MTAMTEKRTGGPAFPRPPVDRIPGSPGMSLRDYFALAGLLAGGDALYKHTVEEIAGDCYQAADAMLKRRTE